MGSPMIHTDNSFLVGPGDRLGSPGSPSKAPSTMTDHFLNSCGLYTKMCWVSSFPLSKGQGSKNRKPPGEGVILLGHLPSYPSLPANSPLSNRDLRSLCGCAQVRYRGSTGS